MKTYKGKQYPDLNNVMNFYKVPAANGGFNTDERNCPTLFLRLPNSVTLALDGINKQELFDSISKYGHIPQQLREQAEAKIDEVCQSFIDNALNGDIM